MLKYILILILCGSCSWLGSRSRIVNATSIKIKRVAIIVSQDEAFLNRGSRVEYIAFTKTLAEELNEKRLFYFQILERRYDFNSIDHLEKSLLATELMDRFDAFLICHAKAKGFNYKVDLTLIQTGKAIDLIQSRHSTATGNSYWGVWHPISMLQDATKGALDGFERKWNNGNFSEK